MFAEKYTMHWKGQGYVLDMRELRAAMKQCGIMADSEEAEVLAEAISDLLYAVAAQAYEAGKDLPW